MTGNKIRNNKEKKAILHVCPDIHKSLKIASAKSGETLEKTSNAILKNGIPLFERGEISIGKGSE